MARKRMIDPSFWDDLNIAKLSIAARLCFIGMVSNADDEGRIEADPRYIKRAVFGFDDDLTSSDVAALLAEIEASCPSVVFYEVEGRALVSFTNWRQYQYIQKPQPSRLPPPPVPDQYDTDTVPASLNRIEKNRKEQNRSESTRARAKTQTSSSEKPEPDPTLTHPAVVAYRDTFHLTPNPELRALIAERATDLARWQDTLRWWKQNNYRPESVGKILDRYDRGDPFAPTNGNGRRANGNGHRPPATARLPDQPELHWAEDETGRYLALPDGSRYEVPSYDTQRVS